MSGHRKKQILILIIIALLAFSFWTGSRYPQLNDKAMMAGDADILGLSFDIVFYPNPEDGLLKQILANTINWLDTNKKGMGFGLLFAPAIMLLFAVLDTSKWKNRFANSLSGLFLGAPLGVCVNCATPIAKGLYDTDKNTERALSALLSSPTLNIVVLSMLFSLLPVYLGVLKLSFSLIIILLGIPLLSKWLNPAAIPQIDANSISSKKQWFVFTLSADNLLVKNDWLSAVKWTLINYTKGLFFILLTTLPLMLLAGLLGNVLVSLFPQNELIQIIGSGYGMLGGLLMLSIVSIIGTFLPVPIAFDIIVVVILSTLGLPVQYTMVLLFTLGIYSIYPFLVVYRFISKKMAIGLGSLVILVGILTGVLAYVIDGYQEQERAEHLSKLVSKSSFLSNEKVSENQGRLTPKELVNTHRVQQKTVEKIYSNESVSITAFEFNKRTGRIGKFKSKLGKTLGIAAPISYSPIDFIPPYAHGRSIASGDLNHDFYPDLVICSDKNLILSINQQNGHFESLQLAFEHIQVLNAAIVDLNQDGWNDLFIAPYKSPNFIMWNRRGKFSIHDTMMLATNSSKVLSNSIAFADFNYDGKTDIFCGNWSTGTLLARYSQPTSTNYLYLQTEKGFNQKTLGKVNGETLSSLASDINGDGFIDLIVANDFSAPDYYYLNNGKGAFQALEKDNHLIPKSAYNTMSVSAADLNNDLRMEYYLDQIDRNLDRKYIANTPSKICSQINDSSERNECEEIMRIQQQCRKVARQKNFNDCPPEYRFECLAYFFINDQLSTVNRKNHKHQKIQNLSKEPEWADYYYFLDYYNNNHSMLSDFETDNGVKQQGGNAILLSYDKATETYQDQAQKFGITSTGWAWNAQFADLNNDTWQDLYIANGFLFKGKQETNFYYQNQDGKTFTNRTNELGLTNYLPSSSFTYADFDLDGDLDILLAPSIGSIYLYENQLGNNHSIGFSLSTEDTAINLIGTQIIIEYGNGSKQVRTLTLSGGFKSFNDQTLYFGLGDFIQTEKVIVQWNNGKIDIINKPLKSNRIYQIVKSNKNEINT